MYVVFTEPQKCHFLKNCSTVFRAKKLKHFFRYTYKITNKIQRTTQRIATLTPCNSPLTTYWFIWHRTTMNCCIIHSYQLIWCHIALIPINSTTPNAREKKMNWRKSWNSLKTISTVFFFFDNTDLTCWTIYRCRLLSFAMQSHSSSFFISRQLFLLFSWFIPRISFLGHFSSSITFSYCSPLSRPSFTDVNFLRW